MEQIGRYKIVGELGRGAMGVVYRAEDPAIGRTVAIKTIRLVDLTSDGERDRQRDRLFREARSAGILSHPGIVTIYDIAEESGMAYVFMEFVDGRTLEQMMSSDEPISCDTIIETLHQTATALDYAHTKGIIHRDIKPANIMVSKDGQAKVTDFGVARIVSQQMTQAGTIMGTPNYMSPEQIQGSAVDGRADQFSLAVVAFELLTGEKPYSADTLPTLLYKIAREQPVAPRRLNPTLGAQVDKVLEKAFAKQPASRYKTCTEFVGALATAVNASPGWRPLKRGSVQALDTVVTSSGVHHATIVEAPPPPEPQAEPTPTPAAAPEPVIPRRAPLRHLDDEPRSSVGSRVAVVVLALAVLGGGVYGYRRYVAEPQQAHSQQNPAPASAAPETRTSPPKTVKSDTPANPVESKPRVAETASNVLPPPPPPAEEPKILAKPKEPAVRKPPVAVPAKSVKPPAEPVTEEHWVKIRSTPPGATVVVDRDPQLTCRTPCDLPLKKGRHSLATTLAGHSVASRIIDVPEIMDVSIDLAQMTGTLAVTSKPTGATIILNGQTRPEKTPAMLKLPPGSYKIVLTLEGRPPFEDEVRVKNQGLTNIGVDW